MDWFLLSIILLPFVAYAEIHYRFPFLPSRLFRKEPEIIFDLPVRGQTGCEIPLFLLVKDAHRFPVELREVQIQITPVKKGEPVIQHQTLNQPVQDRLFTKTIFLAADLFPHPGLYRILASVSYTNSQGKIQTISQDNYRRIPHPPFTIQISREPLPADPGWYWGDLHIHSNYTDDQVEFGAPVESVIQAAKSIGLNFVAITDHSYDLDDHPENYLQNELDLPKWTKFKIEIKKLQKKYREMVVIPGEEVSAGNQRNKNVHCLILNDPKFHPGDGDSAERLLSRRPTLAVTELLQNKSSDAIAIAAHPRENPPFSQRVILGRGRWAENDCRHPHLTALQIMNDASESSLRAGINFWRGLLLQGIHIGITAGNDAHGNFNCFRQISIPFLKMVYHRQHLLGEVRTAVASEQPDLQGILAGIRRHRALISTGPFATIRIKGVRSAEIGDTIPYQPESTLVVQGKSILEYGHWKEFILYFGEYQKREENSRSFPMNRALLEFTLELKLADFQADYVRLEAISQRNEQRYICVTNPIWFGEE